MCETANCYQPFILCTRWPWQKHTNCWGGDRDSWNALRTLNFWLAWGVDTPTGSWVSSRTRRSSTLLEADGSWGAEFERSFGKLWKWSCYSGTRSSGYSCLHPYWLLMTGSSSDTNDIQSGDIQRRIEKETVDKHTCLKLWDRWWGLICALNNCNLNSQQPADSNPVAKGNRSWFLWHNNLYTFGLNFNFGTISYSNCQNLLWRYAHVWFLGWNCNPKFLKLICIIFFNNICLLQKFHFNQGQSSIQCPSLTSRFREKWRREQGFIHVYGK